MKTESAKHGSGLACDSVKKRKDLLDKLGGLPDAAAIVRNNEWLYMLELDTRHSLAIEGYFASEKELKDIIAGKHSGIEILNYYRTAGSIYDLALQYLREDLVKIDVPLIRHIHSELFRETGIKDRGNFRKGEIVIQGAKVLPPVNDLDRYVRCLLETVLSLMGKMEVIPLLARFHTLFESIHPFRDGNGRSGRILMNYLAISLGYPPLIIKGLSGTERNEYYQALEVADIGFHDGFPSADREKILAALMLGDFTGLEDILYKGALTSMDRIIASTVEQKNDLKSLADLATEVGVQPATLRKWVERDKMIAIMKKGKLYSHRSLIF